MNQDGDATRSRTSRVFVYGNLKPGQIGYPRIREHVQEFEAGRLEDMWLVIRDGLPYAVEPDAVQIVNRGDLPNSASSVRGFVLNGDETMLARIMEYEGFRWSKEENHWSPSNLYVEVRLPVLTESGETIEATSFVLKKARKRNHRLVASGEWSALNDPILGPGFAQLVAQLPHLRTLTPIPGDHGDYWATMWLFQGHFANLLSVAERFSLFLFGSLKPNERMSRLDQMLSKHELKVGGDPIEVFEAKDAKSQRKSTSDGFFSSIYQIRSNMFHQGKSEGIQDLRLVMQAVFGLTSVLEELLKTEVPGIQDVWYPR